MPLSARTIIEAARRRARESRDLYLPALRAAFPQADKGFLREEILIRMDLVVDCYLTGAAEMLKMLHGDMEPESWEDDYEHEERLRELLARYAVQSPNSPQEPS
jgi:hypothetical protein